MKITFLLTTKIKEIVKIMKNNDYYKGNMKYLTKRNILSKYLSFTDEGMLPILFIK